MTEKQIKTLKTLLSKSEQKTPSTEFDQAILKAAQEHLEQHNSHEDSATKNSLITLMSLPMGVARSAVIALSVTLVIFVGMGKMLTVDNEALVSLNNTKSVDQDDQVEATPDLNDQRIHKPESIVLTQPPSQILRDKALLESIEINGLPTTDELLANLDISLNTDRSNAQHSIDLAMIDIRSMIDIGELNNARNRYVQLKSIQLKAHCPPCRLPDTLDAFYTRQPNNGSGFKTG